MKDLAFLVSFGPSGRAIADLEGYGVDLAKSMDVPLVISADFLRVSNPGLVAPGFTPRSLTIPSSF